MATFDQTKNRAVIILEYYYDHDELEVYVRPPTRIQYISLDTLKTLQDQEFFKLTYKWNAAIVGESLIEIIAIEYPGPLGYQKLANLKDSLNWRPYTNERQIIDRIMNPLTNKIFYFIYNHLESYFSLKYGLTKQQTIRDSNWTTYLSETEILEFNVYPERGGFWKDYISFNNKHDYDMMVTIYNNIIAKRAKKQNNNNDMWD